MVDLVTEQPPLIIMIIKHTDIYSLSDYGNHLKNLTEQDKRSRFGFLITDYAIDQLILRMIYHPDDHELWVALEGEKIIGFGHMAKSKDDSWELAVSVDSNHQRKGIGDSLIGEMLVWAKFHHISQVFMHCIEENKVIQHLATKHNLQTRERGHGERTAAMEVPLPNLIEINTQLLKEQSDIIQEISELRGKLIELWFKPKVK